jgi:CHAT domain-containing protein
MIRKTFFLLGLLALTSKAFTQTGTLKSDSTASLAWIAVVQEDVPRLEFYINILKSQSTTKSDLETIDVLTAEKLIFQTDYQEALSHIERLKQSERTKTIIHSLILEGKILNRQNQFKKSIEILESVGDKLGNAEQSVRGERWHWLGASRMQTGENVEAAKCFQQALIIFKSDSAKFYVKLALCRIMNGINFKRTGNFQAAEKEYLAAIKILENTPLPKYAERSRAYINLANVYNVQQNYLVAQRYYSKSLELYKTHLNDSNQLAILYINLALCYKNYGNFLASKEYYDKWYQTFNKASKQSLQLSGVQMLVNYGVFLQDFLYEFNHAYEVLKEAEGYLNEDSSPQDQLLFLFAKAQYFEVPFVKDSIAPLLKKARDILLKLPENHMSWFDLYSLESAFATNTQKYERADSLIWLAFVAAKEINTDTANRLSKVHSLWGFNFELQGKHPQAAESFKRTLQLMESFSTPYNPQRIAILNNIGISFFKSNEFDSAHHYLMLAFQSNQLPVNSYGPQFSDPFEVLVTNFYFLQLAMKQSVIQMKDAEVYVLTSYAIIEGKRKVLKSFEDQRAYNIAVRDFFDSAMKYYHQMFTLTGEANYFNKAFEMAEKARYQVLQHSLRDIRVGEFASVTQKISLDEQSTQKQVSLLTKQIVEQLGYGEKANYDLLKEYNNNLVSLQVRQDQMLDSVKNNLPGFYNLKFSATTVSPATLKKDLLKDDMAIIQYHVGYEKVHVLIITKENNYMLLLKDKSMLMKAIRGLSNINRLKLTNEFIPAAHQLYNQLIFPIDSVLRNSKSIARYILIPDGEINYVPFDVLVIKPAAELSKCKFLLSDKMLSYGYSSTLLWQEFSDYAQELKKIRMLAYAPNFNAESASNLGTDLLRSATTKSKYAKYDFPPLQMNAKEVKSISSILDKSGFQNEMVLDIDADEESFKSKNLNQYEIIHLATHGFVDYPTANSSGIAFSFNQASREDGILFMDEIFSLRSHTHLVCLSACQTGFGQVDVGEGMMSMTRAFLYAGVKNLVVSLWAVQDNSTALLMEKFYKQFVKSKSISHSLRKAKLQMLQEAEFSHPYNWAGFIHVGMN